VSLADVARQQVLGISGMIYRKAAMAAQ
jgi:hypothetical protein